MQTRHLKAVAIVGAGFLAILVGLAGLRQLARARSVQLFGRIVTRVDTPERRVALTFDDGPTDVMVDSILSVLSERQVRATFFVTGRHLEESSLAGRRLVAAGHELGNHSYSHERMVFRSPSYVSAEIARTDSLILAAGQRRPIYFRPPYGVKLLTLPWHLAKTNRATIMWDLEPDSYSEVAATANGIVQHVLESVSSGSIILLHIWYPANATSMASVGPLVDSLQARGYAVGTVAELLHRHAGL